ncbi:transposase, partial [Leuconostoc mesenteroides]
TSSCSTFANVATLIEGINRKIKELKRACYGFSNQANMFTRVYQLIA